MKIDQLYATEILKDHYFFLPGLHITNKNYYNEDIMSKKIRQNIRWFLNPKDLLKETKRKKSRDISFISPLTFQSQMTF